MSFFGGYWAASSGAEAVGLFGPPTATAEHESGPFSLTPLADYTGTITPLDGGATGTFFPSSLTWDGDTETKRFTYVADAPGIISISALASPALTILGAPFLLTVLEPTDFSSLQYFEKALRAKLLAIDGVTDIVGTSIFKTQIPETHDLSDDGPAITFFLPSKQMGHALRGSDGTATAVVQFDAWAYNQPTVKVLLEAIRDSLDGPQDLWGVGEVEIMSVVQIDDSDADEPPSDSSPLWKFHSLSEYSIKYRVGLPTLL